MRTVAGIHSLRAKRRKLRSEKRVLGAQMRTREKKKRRLAGMTHTSPWPYHEQETTSRNVSALDNYCLCATKSHGTSADTTGVLSYRVVCRRSGGTTHLLRS